MHGIYCIETGGWYDDTDRTSVRPMLQLLENLYGARYIHRDAATKGELVHYLMKWKNLNPEGYPILYLGFHGSEGGAIRLETVDGQEDWVNHEFLTGHLDSSCADCMVHFGSCGSLTGVDWSAFLERTGASAVSGYEKEVDFSESAAFELAYFAYLVWDDSKSLTTAASTVSSEMMGECRPYRGLSSHLGFVMHVGG